MGTRHLSCDYRGFVSDWLKGSNEKDLKLKLLNFCEGNVLKNKDMIKKLCNVFEIMKKDNGIIFKEYIYTSLLDDLSNYIIDWKIQREIEFNMSDEELTIIRLHLNIIDFNFLLPSDLKERQDTINIILENRF